MNRSRAPLGSAIEITYTWQVEPTAKKLAQEPLLEPFYLRRSPNTRCQSRSSANGIE